MINNLYKFYRVEQSEAGQPRSVLCGATSHENANLRLQSITENMQANGWIHTDDINIKKLSTVVMLTNGERTVTLAVVGCTANNVTGTQLELREMNWLTRVPAQSFDLSGDDDTAEMDVTGETPSDGLFAYLEEGFNDYKQQESVGV